MADNLPLSRRNLIRGAAGLLGLSVMTAGTTGMVFNAILSRKARAYMPNFGALNPKADEATGLALLRLPDGFRYISYGWRGDPMNDGIPTPGSHDGMGVVAQEGQNIVLVRNHEQREYAPSFAQPKLTYDSMANGGTTTLLFDTKKGEWQKSWASLSGTSRNCAGGPTPWNTWLTCEETTVGTVMPPDRQVFNRDHGWVFEVRATDNSEPMPIIGMGRFRHEACAVDPNTGYVHQTEDQVPCGFYRYKPQRYGRLHDGGELQMLKVKGAMSSTDLTGHAINIPVGTVYDVDWVTIQAPTSGHTPGTFDGRGVVGQGIAQNGARFGRLEGAWYDTGSIYFTATNGGLSQCGQVWRYEPAEEKLTLIHVSRDEWVLDSPDNIAVHPDRGIVLCEDGGGSGPNGGQRLLFLTVDGQFWPFAENNIGFTDSLSSSSSFVFHFVLKGLRPKRSYRDSEWCGACFSPDGEWLFVNIQSPGITFAITGPWKDYVPSPTGHEDL